LTAVTTLLNQARIGEIPLSLKAIIAPLDYRN
jgi:hypothetical protein